MALRWLMLLGCLLAVTRAAAAPEEDLFALPLEELVLIELSPAAGAASVLHTAPSFGAGDSAGQPEGSGGYSLQDGQESGGRGNKGGGVI